MKLLATRGTPLEVSLTSNVQTSTFPGYAEHPLTVAAPAAGLTPHEIRDAQRTAEIHAFQ